MIMNRPEIGIKLLGEVGSKLSSANELIELLSINDAKARLSGFLLYRSNRIEKEIIELSREDISAFINLTRETISRKLNELESEEVIKLNGHKKIKIMDKTTLREIFENGK
jgi:CRP/FNR family transcriptional regulator